MMHTPHQAHPNEQGAALITAMLVVALVTTLASAAMWQQWRGVEVEAAERSRSQSVWLLTGGLDWARLILRQDAQSADGAKADHLAEPWAMPLAESRLSTFLSGTPGATETDEARQAFLSGGMIDLQGRFNLGNLIVGGRLSKPWLLRLERLFNVLNLPPSELQQLSENLQKTFPASGSGVAADAPLPPTQFDHLAWFGLSQPTLEALRPYAAWVSPYEVIPVNLNTAPAEVIHAVALLDNSADETNNRITALDMAAARSLVEQRDRDYFRSLEMAQMALSQPGQNTQVLSSTYFSVTSSRFEVRGRLRLDDLSLEEVSHVQRQGHLARVLSRQRTSVSSPAPNGMDYASLQSQFSQ